ncbi:unnamed protein product [Absidia cylindrospora]
MYFHSSGSRHEQYANLRKQQRLLLKQQQQEQQQQQQQPSQQRISTSSNASGTDSGYNSPTSPPLDPHVIGKQQTILEDVDDHDNGSTTSSFVTDTTLDSGSEHTTHRQPKKKRSRKKKYLDQPPRQPDFVYSCPRPLAFPFHNDCHFLPVAEADPRDVARIAPPRRMPSMESTTNTSSTSKASSFDQRSSYSSSRASTSSSARGSVCSQDDDRPSSTHSTQRPASLISSVQQGTVRSLRSLFQLSNNSKSSQQQQQQQQQQSPVDAPSSLSDQQQRLPKLEAKTGTVASLRKLFARHPSTAATPPPPTTPTPAPVSPLSRSALFSKQPNAKKSSHSSLKSSSPSLAEDDADRLTAINTAKNRQSGDTTKHLFFGKRRVTSSSSSHQPTDKPSSVFTIARFWPSKAQSPPSLDDLPRPPSAPPGAARFEADRRQAALPPSPTTKPPPSRPLSGLKHLFSRSSSPSSPPTPTPPPSSTTKPPRRSIFASFRRPSSSSPSPSPPPPPPPMTKDDTTKLQSQQALRDEALPPTPPTTTVGRIWKSFKRLVSGNKSSRVGVL